MDKGLVEVSITFTTKVPDLIAEIMTKESAAEVWLHVPIYLNTGDDPNDPWHKHTYNVEAPGKWVKT